MDGSTAPASQPYRITRADIVREASKRVPTNNLGLPEGFHRSDLLHEHLVKRVVPQEDLLKNNDGLDLTSGVVTDPGPLLILDERAVRLAYVPLDYREGFPTIPHSGVPFWAQLEFEPPEAFYAFEQYLNQGKDEGTRRLFALACTPEIHKLCLGDETVKRLPAPVEPGTSQDTIDNQEYERNREFSLRSNRQLQEWFTLYYWAPRVRAYDLFYLSSIRSGQRMIGLQLQNQHFQDAQRLYHKVLEFIDGTSEGSKTAEGLPRFWAEMSPRTLVDFMKVLAYIQRVSVGLPANAPPPVDSPNSVVGILRSLTEGSLDPSSASFLDSLSGPASNATPSSGGRGRPRITYDENNNVIRGSGSGVGPQSRGTGTAASRADASANQGAGQGSSGGGVDSEIGLSDEEKVRRITILMNTAKARREASLAPKRPDPDPTSGPTPDSDSG